MKNMITAIEALQSEVQLLRNKADILEKSISELKALLDNNFTSDVQNIKSDINGTGFTSPKELLEKYKDYPHVNKTLAKCNYIDLIDQRPFKKKNRQRLMIAIEGESKAKHITDNLSQDLKYLINTGIYVGQKFNNDNKAQFYYRVEWVNLDGQNTTVKPGFELRDEDFEGLPEHKRKNFTWILPGNAS